MVPQNCPTSARNTVRQESERCPAKIGMLSDRNWNHCPTAVGIRIVVTKEDIRTGCDVAALNQLLKDNKDRKITKAIYYAGIHRLASPNLRAIWKEFRRLCGVREFRDRRKKKGARYYKFDACHLLPIINTPPGDGCLCLQIHQQGLREPKAGR